MLTRIITSIAALVVFFCVIYAGPLALQIAIWLVSLCMLYEVFTAATKSRAVKAAGFISGIAAMAGYYIGVADAAAVFTLVVFLVTAVALHGKTDFKEIFAVAILTEYITLFMSYIPLLRNEGGLAMMGFIFLIAWGSDTAAYFCGTFLGKHKLIPRVSPKKTVEGSVGALVCVMVLCMLYTFIMNLCGYSIGGEVPDFAVYAKVGILGAAAAALSQLGDLAASAIKRDAGIKDYGKIFPGHGGFMDRFDSVIFIAPVVYYGCLLFLI